MDQAALSSLLDELIATFEEARSVPMTAGCVVPRGDVLELVDDIKDAIPGELDDAQTDGAIARHAVAHALTMSRKPKTLPSPRLSVAIFIRVAEEHLGNRA